MSSMAPILSASLACQVDGLVKIYTCNKRDAYFEFEKKELLDQAKIKIYIACRIEADEQDVLEILELNSIPKIQIFLLAFLLNQKVNKAHSRCHNYADILNVPIIQIKLEDLKHQC